jgi:mRNA-degrading endonuclease toxin of MazEF toxin-antitoxin module
VAPTTTQEREGTWYVHVHLADQDEFVCLHQVRVIDYRRLHSKLGQLDTDDFENVKAALLRLYG